MSPTKVTLQSIYYTNICRAIMKRALGRHGIVAPAERSRASDAFAVRRSREVVAGLS